ncbi:MAG: DUF2007 domain-containing protein [Chitinophagaceae bacterium]|nr:DUF2007 domain-containing protein [Chitinophagaceae bacterium]
MNFVTVASFDNYIEANIVLGKLQNEGIEAFLKDEYTVTIDPILTNAIGGIKLTVMEQDAEEARRLMQVFAAEKRALLECPFCSSHNVEYISNPTRSGNWLSALVSFFVSSYAVSIEKTYHCFNCGRDFEDLKNAPE